MAFTKVTYTDKSTIITANNLNAIQDEVIRLGNAKINITGGGDYSGNLKMSYTGDGYYLVDGNELQYSGLIDNGENLWMGASSSNTGKSSHVGGTYISSGYNASTKTGNISAYVCIPKDDNSNGGTLYPIWHNGYINYDKLYPVGSCYTMTTNTNPNTIFPGTTWSLINKNFKPTVSTNHTEYFTRNTTNTSAVTSCYIARSGNMMTLRINVTNKVKWTGDSTITVGTVNMAKLGITRTCLSTYTSNVYCDAANSIPVCYLANGNNDAHTATLEIRDVVGNGANTNTGLSYFFNFTWVFHHSYMADDYCDQFIWKRTA